MPDLPEETGRSDEVWPHIAPEHRARLRAILKEQIPHVSAFARVTEQRTGYTSEIGKNMQVDVLSHLGTLAVGVDLTPEQQASQITKIEEHLRRAIIEHPEEVVRNRLVDVRRLWAEYHRIAFPLRGDNGLHGVPRHMELEEMRTRIDSLMDSARKVKPTETTWDESLDAAAAMTEAAHLTSALADKLEQCLGAASQLLDQRRIEAEARQRDLDREAEARQREEDRRVAERRANRRRDRQWAVGLIITAFLAVAGWFVAHEIGKGDDSSGQDRPPRTTTGPVTAPRQ